MLWIRAQFGSYLCMYCTYAIPFCVSAPGYSGETCDSPVDACASSPCYNNGTCSSSSPGMFECACPFGEPALKVVVVVVVAAAVVVIVVTKRERERDGWVDGWMDGWTDGWMERERGGVTFFFLQYHLAWPLTFSLRMQVIWRDKNKYRECLNPQLWKKGCPRTTCTQMAYKPLWLLCCYCCCRSFSSSSSAHHIHITIIISDWLWPV